MGKVTQDVGSFKQPSVSDRVKEKLVSCRKKRTRSPIAPGTYADESLVAYFKGAVSRIAYRDKKNRHRAERHFPHSDLFCCYLPVRF